MEKQCSLPPLKGLLSFPTQEIMQYRLDHNIIKSPGLMIEDNAHYAIDLATHGIPTILLEAPWNIDIDTSSYPDIYRVRDWMKFNTLLQL